MAKREPLDYDALVIGAGISGLYQLYRLRELGMRVRVLEAGSGVGGTWYWNRYPGARFDPSYSYGYSFSQELLDEWSGPAFRAQPETLRYLNFVADKFGLRSDIEFHSRERPHFRKTGHWTCDGRGRPALRTRFLITAIGPCRRRPYHASRAWRHRRLLPPRAGARPATPANGWR